MVRNILLVSFCLIVVTQSSYAAVMDSIKIKELEWIEKALSGAVEIDAYNVDDETALTLAILHRLPDKAFQLLEKGASVNTPGRHNETALIRACDRGFLDLVKELLKQGADPNIPHDGNRLCPSCNRDTGLTYAAVRGHREIVLELIKAGVDLSLEEHDRTILVDLARQENTEMIKLLFSHGMKSNILKDKLGAFSTEVQNILSPSAQSQTDCMTNQ